MELKKIQDLIKFVAESGASEVKLETEEFKITIKTGSSDSQQEGVVVHQMPQMGMPQPMPQAQMPVAQQQPVSAEQPAEQPKEESNLVSMKSPIIGTFYRKPAPDKPPFVEVGDTVKEGDVLCVIEAMKLFNEIESEVSGKVVKVLVDDASPVEFDQPLFLIEPV